MLLFWQRMAHSLSVARGCFFQASWQWQILTMEHKQAGYMIQDGVGGLGRCAGYVWDQVVLLLGHACDALSSKWLTLALHQMTTSIQSCALPAPDGRVSISAVIK